MKMKLTYRIARKLGWHMAPSNSIRSRLYSLTTIRAPWWQWGHRLMVLTGSDFGGNWHEPKPPTWHYKRGPSKRQWRTGHPRLGSLIVIKDDYDEYRRQTAGLNEDQRYEWQAIYIGEDGDLQLGHQYTGQGFYGMRKDETKLLRSYLRMWRRHDWWGLRSWLYSQAIHQAVHGHRPFACAVVPAAGSVGYSHWHCQEKRNHEGPHRYNSMQWTTGNVERVEGRHDQPATHRWTIEARRKDNP